jgi:hypothetical protein
MRNQNELEQIAKDLLSGKIVIDWMIPNDEDVWKVFQAINLLTPEQRGELAKLEVGGFYEYRTAAIDVCDNVPIFATMNVLSKREADEVRKLFFAMFKDHQ